MATDKYSASYIWNVDEKQLKQFIECKPTQQQTSETFSIESTQSVSTIDKLPFKLEVYPNGDSETNNGSFMVYCTLLSDQYKQIISTLRLYCKQTNTSFTSIATFTSQRNSAGWSPETLMLNEVNAKELNIGCDIMILKVIGNDDKVIFEYKNGETLSVNKVYSFKWMIDTERLIDCRCGKSFESDIFDNIWCLRCLPNGKRSYDAGNIKLYLILCGAIPDDNIHISYTLWCNETNTGYNSTIVLNHEYNSVGWPNHILFTKDINNISGLTFNAEIEIITDGIDDVDDVDDNSSTYSSSSSSFDCVRGIYCDDLDEKEVKEEKKEEKEKVDAIFKKHIHKHHKNKKKLSIKEFKAVSLEDIIFNDVNALDNYDIAKKICKFYDSQFDDTDTVCIVAKKHYQPAISYWVKSGYVRKHNDIYGKHILVYRSIKHSQGNKPILSQKEFEEYVRDVSIKYFNDSVDVIAQLLDNKFGEGCHYARNSSSSKYDIYSRFSDKYECSIKLPSGAYIIAWRR